MKYLRPDLREEYTRLTELNPDLVGICHPLINISDALKAYFILADYFTDPSTPLPNQESMLVGLRSADLLASALGRQNTEYEGHIKYSRPLDICATLFYGMVKNHAFSDGNKRTALLLLIYQLNMYGYLPYEPVREFERLVVSVAANRLSSDFSKDWKKFKKHDDCTIETIAFILKRFVKKKDHTYHIQISAKDFCAALGQFDVTYSEDNSKLHFSRVVSVNIWGKKREAKYSIPFNGWTRVIGPKVARDVLENLKLYDQLASYADFIEGAELFYSLIDEFEVPLRRLKDE